MGGIQVAAILTPTGWMFGEIAEIIIYSKDLNDTEKNLVGNYLATRYGTTWTDI